MEITYVLVADAASIGPAGKVNVLGAFTAIMPAQFPHQHPHLAIALATRSNPTECGSVVPAVVRLIAPDGNELIRCDVEIQWADQGNVIAPTENLVINLNNVLFPEPGVYRVEASTEGSEREWTIDVIERPPSSNNDADGKAEGGDG